MTARFRSLERSRKRSRSRATICSIMIRSFLIVPLLLASTIAWSQAGGAVSDYAGLRDRARSGDLSVDFKNLRISYIDSPEAQHAKDTDQQSKQMIRAINAKDFAKAIKNAEVVLENDYTDMDAHFAEYIAYRELGDSKQADFHRAIFDHLIHSILDTGDGKSKDTAYVVASVHEEYVVLRVLGMAPRGQSLVHEGGHSYDLLDVLDQKSSNTTKLYFNVDVSMSHMMKVLGGK